ncbi:TRAP transporter substrate-binding protein DctP [Jiella pelagia]|uniref:TRAP transporter substrate-binding protein DctP n=1 Tax=Jiella pelagia TaxID=2986949 RepID=A0ABY7BVK2_9HYPH|nr:TRAP transporter substrate-binding protein DctP [Jiella pelagia]WAP66769.1 TRAP transporter substrate-binding protein DctP [Jiella pelagia]
MTLTRKDFLKTIALGGAVTAAGLAAPRILRAQTPTLLRMNMVIGNQDPMFPMWQDFGRRIEEASDGTLKIEVFPTETLGKTVDMIEAVSRGAPILQDSDPSHLYNYVPDFAIFMAPYMFKKPEDIGTAWNSEMVAGWEEKLHERGLRVLTMTYFGTRHLLSKRQVMKREDTAGMKIRNAPTKMWNEVGRVLGGEITNTAWSEVYTALSQGVAEGAESPLSILYSARLYETLPYISLTGHLVATTSIVMSQSIYDGLPDPAKKALDTVGRDYTAIRQPMIEGLESEYRGKLEEAGIVFNDVDKSGFIAAAAETPKNFPEWTPGMYEKMLEIIA